MMKSRGMMMKFESLWQGSASNKIVRRVEVEFKNDAVAYSNIVSISVSRTHMHLISLNKGSYLISLKGADVFMQKPRIYES